MLWFTDYFMDKPLVNILDIAIVWYVVYLILTFVRGTRAMNVLKGVAVIIIAKLFSSLLGLQTVDWILQQVISWGVIATIVLFQPEIRKALERLGRGLSRTRRTTQNRGKRMIDDLEQSISYMSKRRIGALISIEHDDTLAEYIQTGIPLHAHISHQLLTNIFIPNTPLHDGAVIISDYQIAAAACYLPLSESLNISKELGTRHRAGIGLSEVSDALTIIVSEETGGVSLTKKGILHRDLNTQELHDLLTEFLYEETDIDETTALKQTIRNLINNTFKTGGDR